MNPPVKFKLLMIKRDSKFSGLKELNPLSLTSLLSVAFDLPVVINVGSFNLVQYQFHQVHVKITLDLLHEIRCINIYVFYILCRVTLL